MQCAQGQVVVFQGFTVIRFIIHVRVYAYCSCVHCYMYNVQLYIDR